MSPPSLEALNYDIFIALITCLDVSDIVTLSECSRLLKQFALSHQTWVVLGRRLVSQGIPLPTKGFRVPDDLNTGELIESVVKDKIYRRWTSRSARATKMTAMSEGDSQFTQEALTRCIVVPITSDIVAILLGKKDLAIWDVPRGTKLAQLSSCFKMLSIMPSPFFHEVDLCNRAFYFLMYTSTQIGGSGPCQINVMKMDFARLTSNLSEAESALSFEDIASFPRFSVHRRFGRRLLTGGGFILNARERRACEVYIDLQILLFVVLDWDKREAAFIDTGISHINVPPTQAATGLPTQQVYVCTWDSRNQTLVFTVDAGCSTVQHVYHAAQLLPFMLSFDAYTEKFDVDTIPVVPPSKACAFSCGAQVPQDESESVTVYQTGFRTPWHEFSGVSSPAPFSRPFYTHSEASVDPSSGVRVYQIPLRGNKFFTLPAPGSGNGPSVVPLSLATDGPGYYIGTIANLFSARYGAIAWVKKEETEGTDFVRILRITRFPCPFYKGEPVAQGIVRVCTPLLPDGDPIRVIDAGSDGVINFSIDEVHHGRLFLIYSTGRVVVLHFD